MCYNIEIYTKKNCLYCIRAKDFLIKRSLKFTEISIDDDVSNILYLEMCDRSGGSRTVPQIFINGNHIGGSDDLMKFQDHPDKLNNLLNSQNF